MLYKILKEVEINKNSFNKKKIHNLGSEPAPDPHKLRIVKYDDDDGYYLLYIDYQDDEITDTYHESIIQAMEQAEWEFNIKYADWKNHLN